jgi:hypothetical protein
MDPLIPVAVGALAIGASGLRLVEIILRKNSRKSRHETSTSGEMDPGVWEAKMDMIFGRKIDEKILPLLNELKNIAQRQVDISQKQNEILVELVTVSRIGIARPGGS